MILKYKSDDVTPIILRTSIFAPHPRAQSEFLILVLNWLSLPLQGQYQPCLFPSPIHTHPSTHTHTYTHEVTTTTKYFCSTHPLLFPRAHQGSLCPWTIIWDFYQSDTSSLQTHTSLLHSLWLIRLSLKPYSILPFPRKSWRAPPQAVRLHVHDTIVLWSLLLRLLTCLYGRTLLQSDQIITMMWQDMGYAHTKSMPILDNLPSSLSPIIQSYWSSTNQPYEPLTGFLHVPDKFESLWLDKLFPPSWQMSTPCSKFKSTTFHEVSPGPVSTTSIRIDHDIICSNIIPCSEPTVTFTIVSSSSFWVYLPQYTMHSSRVVTGSHHFCASGIGNTVNF